MQAYLCDPYKNTVTEVEFDGIDDIYEHIQCDTFALGHIEGTEDSVFVDDNGLLTMDDDTMFSMFRGAHQPFAGRALWIGPPDSDGDNTPPTESIENVRRNFTPLSFAAVQLIFSAV